MDRRREDPFQQHKERVGIETSRRMGRSSTASCRDDFEKKEGRGGEKGEKREKKGKEGKKSREVLVRKHIRPPTIIRKRTA